MENIFIDFVETLGFLLSSALEIIAKNIVNISSRRRKFDYTTKKGVGKYKNSQQIHIFIF